MAKRQSAVYRRKVGAGQSKLELSALVRKHLGLDIPPHDLAKFICAQFVLLSILCHEIHEAEKP